MDHCPVLIKIVNDEIKSFYDEEKQYNYLLQVWSRSQEKKVFERKLRGNPSFEQALEPIVNWSIVEYFEADETTHRSYLLYRCGSSDENSDRLHIADLEPRNDEYIGPQ